MINLKLTNLWVIYMKSKKNLFTIKEQKSITALILKGLTLKQIAKELHCAKSTISYKANKLFKEFNAKDRHEFVVNIFTNIITRYKNQITKLQQELEIYKKY